MASRGMAPARLAVAAALLVASCDNPRTAALRELDRRGLPANAVALAGAADRGDHEVLDLLLTAGVFPDHRDAGGRTPLIAAVGRGDVATAFRLIQAGANPDAQAGDESTVISVAVACGEIAVIDRLLKAGAWPDGRMPDGDRLVPWAIRHGRLLVLEHILDHGSLDPNQHDQAGNPLVHVALAAERPEILTALLDRGADPSALDTAGRSLLLASIQDRPRPLVDLLLARGTDASSRPPAAGSTITAAAGSTITAAIDRGWPELAAALVARGADPNQPAADGRTPLDLALAARNPDLTTTIVRLGARPGSGHWNDLLDRLCHQHELPLLGALLSAGVPADFLDQRGRPIVEAAFADQLPAAACLFLGFGAPARDALYQAVARGDRAAVRLLLDHRCLANPARTPWLDTPLAAAARAGDAPTVRLLLDYGTDPETPGLEGQRPLAVAALLGHGAAVAALLDAGADPEAAVTHPVSDAFAAHADSTLQWTLKRDERVSPLMLAAHSGDVEAIGQLLAHGAQPHRYTRHNKRYPINFASRKGHVAAMRLLLGKDPAAEQRRIVIDLSDQAARVLDAAGAEIFSFPVSTGRKGYATPTGDYVITNKHRHWTSTLYQASMPYFQRLSCGDFGLHQGNVPGYPASHGCIRVPAGKAARLFALTDLGDRVQIVR